MLVTTEPCPSSKLQAGTKRARCRLYKQIQIVWFNADHVPPMNESSQINEKISETICGSKRSDCECFSAWRHLIKLNRRRLQTCGRDSEKEKFKVSHTKRARSVFFSRTRAAACSRDDLSSCMVEQLIERSLSDVDLSVYRNSSKLSSLRPNCEWARQQSIN